MASLLSRFLISVRRAGRGPFSIPVQSYPLVIVPPKACPRDEAAHDAEGPLSRIRLVPCLTKTNL